MAFVALVIGTATAAAQSVTTPRHGSAERKAIMDAIRVPVEKDLNQKVSFVVSDLNVKDSWAFVGGRPQKPSGDRIDLSLTDYEDDGMFDDNFFGLLRKRSGKWHVVTYAVGCTDVCYATWWEDHKAPKALFPYTE